MSMGPELTRRNRKLAGILVLLAVGMFGFGYALVPLYEIVCQAFGVNGKTGRVDAIAAETSTIDVSRWVTVEFTGEVMGALPWEFRPLQPSIRLHPGQTATVRYLARNLSGRTVVAQAAPSVSPSRAAPHFKKVECFCFTRQELAAGEDREMAVTFLLARDLPPEVSKLTLSYAFFDTGTAGRSRAPAFDTARPPTAAGSG